MKSLRAETLDFLTVGLRKDFVPGTYVYSDPDNAEGHRASCYTFTSLQA